MPATDEHVWIEVPPTAVPRWDRDLQTTAFVRRYLRDEGLASAVCELTLAVGPRGELEDLIPEDCPPPLLKGITKLGSRWGFDIIDAKPGDGTRYRLSIEFRAE